jgi:hypothetical protein
MKNLTLIRKKQQAYLEKVLGQTLAWLETVDKAALETVLLSGSVARGDYWPGKYGAMVDLTVMTRPGAAVTAEALFGKNEDPDIPYHCVQRDGQWYSIAFHPPIGPADFAKLDEAKKFALLESRPLWEGSGAWSRDLVTIGRLARVEQARLKADCLGYAAYLLSDYKQNRWEQRDAWPQLHANLDTAIQGALRALYYHNGRYAPAEDRRLYYSHGLERLPEDWERLLAGLLRRDIESETDYRRREKLFSTKLLPFLTAP